MLLSALLFWLPSCPWACGLGKHKRLVARGDKGGSQACTPGWPMSHDVTVLGEGSTVDGCYLLCICNTACMLFSWNMEYGMEQNKKCWKWRHSKAAAVVRALLRKGEQCLIAWRVICHLLHIFHRRENIVNMIFCTLGVREEGRDITEKIRSWMSALWQYCDTLSLRWRLRDNDFIIWILEAASYVVEVTGLHISNHSLMLNANKDK